MFGNFSKTFLPSGGNLFNSSSPASPSTNVAGASTTGFGLSKLSSSSGTSANTMDVKGTVVRFDPHCTTEYVRKGNTSIKQMIKYMSLCFMKAYENKSLDELRWEDYQENRKGNLNIAAGSQQQQQQQPQQSSFGTAMFSSGGSATAGKSLFGSSTSSAPSLLFQSSQNDQQKPSLFSSNTSSKTTSLFSAPAAQSNNATSSLFGSSTTSSILGNSQTSTNKTNLFASNTPSFALSSGLGGGGGLFASNISKSQPSTTMSSIFSPFNTTATTTTTSNLGSSLFSTLKPATTTTTSSILGGGSGLFGTSNSLAFNKPTTSSLFGNTSTTTATTTATTNSPSSVGFGLFNSQQNKQTSNTGGGLFSNQTGISSTTVQKSLFGNTANSSGSSLFSGGSTSLFSNTKPTNTTSQMTSEKSIIGHDCKQSSLEIAHRLLKETIGDPYGDLNIPRNFEQTTPPKHKKSPYKPEKRTSMKLFVCPNVTSQNLSSSNSTFPSHSRGSFVLDDHEHTADLSLHKRSQIDNRSLQRSLHKSLAPAFRNMILEPMSLSDTSTTLDMSTMSISLADQSSYNNRDVNESTLSELIDSFSQRDETDDTYPECNLSRIPAIKLTKQGGYYTLPEQSELTIDRIDGTCNVQDFTVGRANVGYIKWPGITNVAGLNIDDTISIEDAGISVYPDPDRKPPTGTKLNKSAQVTLANIYPVNSMGQSVTDPSAINDLRYTEWVEQETNLLPHAHFLDYEAKSGTWRFMVDHF